LTQNIISTKSQFYYWAVR